MRQNRILIAMLVLSCLAGCTEKNSADRTEEPVVPAEIGDFYYDDGTWSSELDGSKEVIGIVFYAGDPTAEDPALKADFPECTNGLVVSLAADDGITSWQSEYQTYWDEQEGFVGRWAEANMPHRRMRTGR